jgi:hypothetical protein
MIAGNLGFILLPNVETHVSISIDMVYRLKETHVSISIGMVNRLERNPCFHIDWYGISTKKKHW